MGMFDTIYVESKLLHDHKMLCQKCKFETIDFQTKDFDSVLEYYYLHYVNDKGRVHFMKSDTTGIMFDPDSEHTFTLVENNPEWPHQWVSIYASCGECNEWNEYKLKFTDGVLQRVERVNLVRVNANGTGIQV